MQDEHVRTSNKDAQGLGSGTGSGDFQNLGTIRESNFFNSLGLSELISLELVDVGDWNTTDSLGKSVTYITDEVNFSSFDVLDNHDFLLGEEMQSQIVDGISQNTLLNQENIGT